MWQWPPGKVQFFPLISQAQVRK